MEIQVNKDLRKFESKDIGMFSFRQAAFIVAGFVIAGISLFIQKKLLGVWTLEATVFPAVPVWVVGFLKIQGLSVIDYIKMIFPEQFLIPKTLKWESDFEYDPYTAQDAFGEDYEEIPMIKATDPPTGSQKAKTTNKKKKKSSRSRK